RARDDPGMEPGRSPPRLDPLLERFGLGREVGWRMFRRPIREFQDPRHVTLLGQLNPEIRGHVVLLHYYGFTIKANDQTANPTSTAPALRFTQVKWGCPLPDLIRSPPALKSSPHAADPPTTPPVTRGARIQGAPSSPIAIAENIAAKLTMVIGFVSVR